MKASPSWLGSSLSQPTRRYRKRHRAQVPYSYQGQPRPKGNTSLPGSISSCSAANQLKSKRSEACPYFKRKQKDVAAAPSLLKNLKIWSYKVHTGGTQQTRFEEGVGEGRQRLNCCHPLNLDQAIHGKMGLSQERPSRAGRQLWHVPTNPELRFSTKILCPLDLAMRNFSHNEMNAKGG